MGTTTIATVPASPPREPVRFPVGAAAVPDGGGELVGGAGAVVVDPVSRGGCVASDAGSVVDVGGGTVVAVVAVVVDWAAAAALTTRITPVIQGCGWQWYAYVPGFGKARCHSLPPVT